MAIRGKVKDVKDMGNYKVSGTVTDTSTKIDYYFEQPYGAELGLAPNSIVQFETVRVADKTIGVSLDPVDKATIESIDLELGTGVILDRSGNKIEFSQNYCKELGLNPGMVVKFTPVNINGTTRATSLKTLDTR